MSSNIFDDIHIYMSSAYSQIYNSVYNPNYTVTNPITTYCNCRGCGPDIWIDPKKLNKNSIRLKSRPLSGL